MDMALHGRAGYCTYTQYPTIPAEPQALAQRQPRGKATSAMPPPLLPLSQTRIVKKLDPDQAGAKKLARRFGTDLVCVRYRQDRAAGQRYTTVEIVVDGGPIATDKRQPAVVLVRIEFKETALRQAALQHGATWDAHRRAWRIGKDAVHQLDLYDRILRK